MDFDWDENKRLANLGKHQIDFLDAKEIWEGPIVEIASVQSHHNEDRYIALGLLDSDVIAVIYTWRRQMRRIISARRARINEKALYENAFGRGS